MTGAGSQPSIGASRSLTDPEPLESRADSTNSRIAVIRSAGSGSSSAAVKRAPVNRLPPCGSSCARRLIGMPRVSVPTGAPSRSWYRRNPPRMPARKPSLSEPPAAFDPALRSASGTSSTSKCQAPPRVRSSAEPLGGGARVRVADRAASMTELAASHGRSSLPSPSARRSSRQRSGFHGLGDLTGQQRRAVDLARHGHRRLRPRRVVLRRPAVQRAHQLDGAETVGRAVVRLDDVARPAVGEALDEEHLPQRPVPVERRGRELADDVEELPHRAGGVEADPPQVPVDVHAPRRSPSAGHRRPVRARPPAAASAAPSATPTRGRPAGAPSPAPARAARAA